MAAIDMNDRYAPSVPGRDVRAPALRGSIRGEILERKFMRLLSWIWQTFFPSRSAVFESAYSVSDSVVRLQSAMRRHSLLGLVAQGPWGKVSAESVKLELVYGTHGKPIFKGEWRKNNNHIVLMGKFIPRLYYRIFYGYAFWFMIIWISLTSIKVIREFVIDAPQAYSAGILIFPLAGIAIFCTSMGFARVEYVAWERQVKTLSDFIGQTLRQGD